MIAIPDKNFLSPQQYLDWEVQQPIRYEYVNGHVYAMTGGTLPHNEIAVNLAVLLKNLLRGQSCRVLVSDAKVAISDNGPFLYPDVSVSCHSSDRTAIQSLKYPCLITEVLSPSTEAYDRGGKFAQYRQLQSLKEYLLISSTEMAVDVFRLNERGKWELSSYKVDDEIELASVKVTISVTALYEEIVLATQQSISQGN